MSEIVNRELSPDELDTIGEIMNISMGAAATAVSNMLERQVVITTPSMEQEQYKNIDSSGLEPALLVKIKYVQGIEGINTTMLKRQDMQVILDILMGNEEPMAPEDFEFDDMSMSAACEIMNQMMGASATALSEILETPINISTPEAILVESMKTVENSFLEISMEEPVIAISFNMKIKDVLNTTFITFLPIDLVLHIIARVNGGIEDEPAVAVKEEIPAPPMQPQAPPMQPQAPPMQPQAPPMQPQAPPMQPQAPPMQPQAPPMQPSQGEMQANWGVPPQQMAYAMPYGAYGAYGAPQQGIPPMGANPYGMPQQETGGFVPPPVTVKKAEFPDFSQQTLRSTMPAPSNMGLLMGVQLEISVIIGKTKRKIKDIMDFGQGTVIELDKQTGAPAEIVVNGQLLAYGDVIVVGDNFGIRVTEIVGSKELVDLLGNNG